MGTWLDSAKKNIQLKRVHGVNVLRDLEKSYLPMERKRLRMLERKRMFEAGDLKMGKGKNELKKGYKRYYG